MGWRDINMNRRKPPLRLAAIAMAPGEDRRAAVLRKSASQALETLSPQLPLDSDETAKRQFSPFIGGYVLGYARQVALKHGISLDDGVDELAAALERQIAPMAGLQLISNGTDPRWDAGLLVGRLEALCATRHLVSEAILCWKRADAASAFLTACDNAADPMQSRAPTQSLRFTREERGVIVAGFERLGTWSDEGMRLE
jgi:hypothetical protein